MRRGREKAVELTPLLDVILIMLFLIMSQSRDAAANAREEAANAVSAAEERYEGEIERLSGELETVSAELEDVSQSLYYADNRINAYEKFDRYAKIVSLSLRDKDGEREIFLSDGSRTAEIPLNWDNMRYGENALRAELSEYKNSEEPVFIVFSYNAGQVYQRDFETVSAVMSEAGENENVYIKYNEIN